MGTFSPSDTVAAILVVEDDQDTSLACETLAAEGHRVLEAANGCAALRLLARERVDLLFTDLVMPGVNGLDLAERARAARPGLKILYTSGYTRHPSLPSPALPLDGVFLPKPYRPSELVGEVRRLLDAA
jgi:CheY-like chemotaxis protein